MINTIIKGILLFYIFIHIKYVLFIHQANKKSEELYLKDIDKKLKHGDILMFGEKNIKIKQHVFSKMIGTAFLNTVFFHAGLIIQKNNKKYILHTWGEGFKKYLKKQYLYKNKTIQVHLLNDFLNIYNAKCDIFIKAYRNNNFGFDYKQIFRSIKNFRNIKVGIPDDNENVICTQFVGKIIENLNPNETKLSVLDYFTDKTLIKKNYKEIGTFDIMI